MGKSEKNTFVFLIVFILVSTNFLSCSLINRETTKMLNFCFLAFIFLQLLTNRNNRYVTPMFFKKEVIALIMFPVLSGFSCTVLEGQSLFSSVKAAVPMTAFALYFYLHKKRTSAEVAMKAVFIIGVLIALIQIIQQLLPNYAIFGIEGDGEAEIAANMEHRMRNGLYRFLMHYNGIFTFSLLYYSWSKIRQKYSGKYMLFFFLMLLSAYLSLTRQVIVVVMASLLISLFAFKERTSKKLTIILCLIFGIVLIYNFDSLFADFISKSVDDVDNENYARYYSMAFFWKESTSGLVAILFGHGLPSSGSQYDLYIQKLADMQCYASDVGAIGAAFKFGWVYVLVFYVMVGKVWLKYRKQIPSYLTLFLVSTMFYSVFMFLISKNYYILPFAIVLYVIDLHLSKSVVAFDKKKGKNK